MFHDAYGEECKNLVESLTTEKKAVPIVPVISAAVDIPKVAIDFQDFVTKPVEPPVDERLWPSSSTKYREKDYDWDASNSYSRSSSKYEEEYSSRSSSKYYDKYERKERDRDRDYKYGHHSSHRGDDYERDRHKRERDKDRRSDYRSKERDRSRKDRDYYEYKDNHRGYRDYAGKRESSAEHYNYGYNYPYPSGSSAGWAPPPPKGLPEDSPPRPPPEPPNDDDTPKNKHKLSTEDGEATVDLDTRIAMLFKSKSFGSDVPSLFQLDEDSDKEAKHEEVTVEDGESKNDIDLKKLKIEEDFDVVEDGELTEVKVSDESSISTVPSPYESRVTFRVNRKYCKSRKRRRNEEKVKVESGASDISSSEDELLAKGSYSPPLPPKNDEMSLSSLSSTEPIKEEVVDMKDFDPTTCMYPVGFSSYNASHYYQNSFHHFQQPNNWLGSGYKKEQQGSDDPHEVAVKKVIDKLILELKQILKKDFNKRMIENTAYKKYEAWWDDQERNKNTRSYQKEEESAVVTPVPVALAPAPILDQYQQAGGLGIFRNLRFQRIKREPAPIQQEEDSRKSDDQDDDDMVHGSDSEKEDIQQTSKTSYIKRTISASSSSESSSSESEESSEDEEEREDRDDHVYSSDTASIMSDDELKKTPLKKEKENLRIYSDTESDLEELPEVPKAVTSKVKQKIYSDSEDDEPPPPGTSNDTEPEREKTPEPEPEVEAQPEVQSDSDFFNDDVMSKPPRTPGRISSDEKEPPEKKEERMYSDSEEERDYQEKIRRNTEWMEQVEREEKEQKEKQRQLKAQQKEDVPSSDTSRAPSPETTTPKSSSFDEPCTPTTSLPPPTPGAHIKTESLEKKKRGRPKGSVGKPKEPKKVKNGKIVDISPFAQPHPSAKPEMEQKYSLKMSPYSSSDGGSSHASLVAQEHCYSLPPSASPSLSSSPHDIHLDHDYCGKSDVQPLQSIQPSQLEEQNKKEQTARPVGRPRKDPNAPKAQYTKKDKSVAATAAAAAVEKQKSPKEPKVQKIDLKQHQSMVENFVPVSRYEKRTNNDEFEIICKFLTKGIDEEDVTYMRRAYSYLIQNDIPGTELLHQVHWVDHCATDRTFEPSAPKKRKRDNDLPEMKQHVTGCARTEGYYKIDSRCKAAYKYHHLKGTVAGSHLDNSAKMAVAKMQNASREARSNQRRLLTAFGGATESDLLKFNQLKFRKKQLKFAKSAIHDWGLFAMEPIAADEMVIEYVGQMVRPSVADLRETKYEAIGIGSSYLFRIDMETIIDATKCGNLARFINHSCNVSLFCDFSFQKFTSFFPSSAQLLRKSHHNRVGKENCHLLEAADRRQRRNHLRLQIPTGR